MMKQKLQEIREEAVKQIQNSDALDKLNDEIGRASCRERV